MSGAHARQYYVYILTNGTRTLYVGMTNDLERRMYEHKAKLVAGFTSKYNLTWLAYYEQTSDVESAIARGEANKALAPQQENHTNRVVKPTLEGSIHGLALRLINDCHSRRTPTCHSERSRGT